jgi:hypothetical protein
LCSACHFIVSSSINTFRVCSSVLRFRFKVRYYDMSGWLVLAVVDDDRSTASQYCGCHLKTSYIWHRRLECAAFIYIIEYDEIRTWPLGDGPCSAGGIKPSKSCNLKRHVNIDGY